MTRIDGVHTCLKQFSTKRRARTSYPHQIFWDRSRRKGVIEELLLIPERSQAGAGRSMEHGIVAPAVPDPQSRRSETVVDEQVWWVPKVTIKEFFTSFTFAVMVVEVIVFVLAVLGSNGLVAPNQNATFGPSRCSLIAMGAKFSPFVVHKDEYWRILTASFVHSGLITLMISCMLQFILMLPVELDYGRRISFIIFLLSGATGYTFSCVASPTTVDTGALATIMGFVGFRLAHDILDWPSIALRERRRVGALEAVAAFVVLIVGQSPFVDNYGAFAGFVIGCFIGGAYFAEKIDTYIQSQRIVVAMAILALTFVMFICGFLLGAGRFPLIDQVVFSLICADASQSVSSLLPI